MQRIIHRTFDGLIPRLEPSLLAENAAQIARDVDLRRGVLTPVLGRATDVDVPGYDCGAGKTCAFLWRYRDWTLTLGTLGNLDEADWIALGTSAGFKLTIDGTDYQVVPDFGFGVTLIGSVARVIQSAIRNATGGMETVVWSSETGDEHLTIHASAAITGIAAPTGKTNLATSTWMNGPGTSAETEGKKWLTWANPVNVVNGTVNDDPYSRVYFTGDGVPKMQMRIGGEDVTREMKIEKPATAPDAGSEAPYVAAEDVDARAAFAITEARWQGYSNGTPRLSVPVSFQKSGDTVTLASAGCSVGALYMALQFKVNGTWEDGFDEGKGYWHIDILDPTGAYKMQFDFDGGGSFHWVRSAAGYLSWSGSIKLIYTGGTQVPDDSVAVTYCCSFVTDIGEEGPLSDASEVYLAEPDTDIVLDALPQPTDAQRGIVTIRLYRAAGGVFKWLADVPVGTTTYTDTAPDVDDDLGEEANSDTTNPPDDLQGLIACAGGWYAAFRGREFLASEAFIPTSWPDAYRDTVQAPIVALASTGNDTFIMTEGRPVMMSGSDPSALTAVNIECDQSCVSAAGVALVGQQVIYPSPDGLMAMYAGAAKVITGEWFRREDWQALVPEGIRAAAHDGRYYALLSGLAVPSVLVVDFGESVDRMTTAAGADLTGLYADLLDDTLYVIEQDEVRVWRGGTTALQLDWRGREWLFPRPVSFAVLRVLAAAYTAPVGEAEDARPLVTLYANGVEVLARRVTGPTAAKLPMLRPERRWSLRVQSSVEVSEVNLATGMGALTS